MSNQFKLLTITFITLILSGVLFYQGLKPDYEETTVSSYDTQSQEASNSTVLGEKSDPPSFLDNAVAADVSKVVDGDTIEVIINGEKYKLRYIGINTPETVDPRRSVECFGREASNENKRLVEGKRVYLQKDISETDKYSRLLRYVYLPLDDGSLLFLNDYLIRQGFAQASNFPPDVKYVDQFKLAQKEAKDNNRGLWASCSS